VLEAGSVRMELFSEEETATVSCEPCRKMNDLSEMKRADMRHHVAGHAFLSALPASICGFCGLDVGCTLVVKGDKLHSSCSLKLAYFNYSKHEGAREVRTYTSTAKCLTTQGHFRVSPLHGKEQYSILHRESTRPLRGS
jgi:hypothetical protein